MDRNNENKISVHHVVDIGLLGLESLIEEREAYENEFFSIEPSTDEFDYLISEYEPEIDNKIFECILEDYEYDFIDPFEYEDYLMQLRDEKLIEEQEEFEANYFAFADLVDDDLFDFQIESLNEEEKFLEENGPFYDYDYDYDYDYEDYEYDQYEEEMFWNLYYLKKSQFTTPKCGCAYLDYMPNDDGFCDYLDCYDYPEGPDENLGGIKYY